MSVGGSLPPPSGGRTGNNPFTSNQPGPEPVMRTHDFQDRNGNGTDDRDENQGGPSNDPRNQVDFSRGFARILQQPSFFNPFAGYYGYGQPFGGFGGGFGGYGQPFGGFGGGFGGYGGGRGGGMGARMRNRREMFENLLSPYGDGGAGPAAQAPAGGAGQPQQQQGTAYSPSAEKQKVDEIMQRSYNNPSSITAEDRAVLQKWDDGESARSAQDLQAQMQAFRQQKLGGGFGGYGGYQSGIGSLYGGYSPMPYGGYQSYQPDGFYQQGPQPMPPKPMPSSRNAYVKPLPSQNNGDTMYAGGNPWFVE